MVDFTSRRNSLKISVKLLYYLTFYYQYINVNVGVVQADDEHISDTEDYTNLPIVDNYDHECSYNQMDNLNVCDRAWHVVNKMEITGTELNSFENIDLESCYQKCLNEPTCVAIRRLFAYSDNKCWLFAEGYKRIGNDKYITHFLKCCSLEENQKSLLDFQNLPIVSDPTESCYPENHKCKFQAFHHIERRTFNGKAYSSPRVKNSFECMNMCLEEPLCKAYQFHVDSQFDISCLLYKNGEVNPEDNRLFHVYQKICCNVYMPKFWPNKKTNLLMLHQPSKVCDDFSSTKVGNCNWKFWHVEDELRMKDHYKEIYFEKLQHCLNECVKDFHCFGISVDWAAVRCLFFKKKKSFTKYYGQKKWSSYTLSCCQKMRNTNLHHLTSIKNFPVIENLRGCLPRTNMNPKSCTHRAWLIIRKIILTKPIKSRVGMNLQACLHYCWLTVGCYHISVDVSHNQCLLFNRNAERFGNDGYETYDLSCCELKDTKTIR